jgi:hypothetical protein
MSYIAAWDWFDEFQRAARIAGDVDRQRLSSLAYQAWRYQDANQFTEAFETFRQGADLARRLNERCWELFFDYWCAQGMLYHTRQIQGALDALMRLTVRAHKPEYAHCNPMRGQIFFTMADAYFEVDVYGYADEIRELLTMIEADIPMDKDTHLRVLTLKSDLHYQFEEYDKALAAAHYYLSQAEGHVYRLYSGYVDLRRLAYTRGDIAEALEYAKTSEVYAGKKESQLDEADCKLWQAAFHKRLGNDSSAHALHRQGMALFEQYDFVRWLSYYDAVCEYLELCDNPEAALKMREQQVENVKLSDGRLYECNVHLQYCRLLGRMGKPLDEALQAAEAVCERLRKPEYYRQRLTQIRNGEYHEFAWQKQYAK